MGRQGEVEYTRPSSPPFPPHDFESGQIKHRKGHRHTQSFAWYMCLAEQAQGMGALATPGVPHRRNKKTSFFEERDFNFERATASQTKRRRRPDNLLSFGCDCAW